MTGQGGEPTTVLSLRQQQGIPIYIGVCCREWPLAVGQRGRCGLCGETPTFLRAVNE